MKTSFGEFFLSCKECVLENPRSFYGSFSLGPFGNTQSLTIANALRRTLLTEIGGISITHVHIDGVFHEYSTIEGVRESVLDILLNFKQIVLKTSKPFKKAVYGYLNVRGPGIVRISDFKLPPNVQCVDPDQYIATLNENGKLSLKVRISDFLSSNLEISGSLNTQSEAKNQQTNFLLVDTTFNPILKVNYLIENLPAASFDLLSSAASTASLPTRGRAVPRFAMGKAWEGGKQEGPRKSRETQVISLELWTNGSIHPRKALNLAMSFLKNIFEKFHDMEHFSWNLSSSFFESDETLLKILKTFEYDFRFYGADFVSVDFRNPVELSFNEYSKSSKKISRASPPAPFPRSSHPSHASPEGTAPLASRWEKRGTALPEAGSEAWDGSARFAPIPRSDGFATGAERGMGAKQGLRTVQPKITESLDSPVQVLALPSRVEDCLIRNHFLTIGDVLEFVSQEKKDVQKFSGLGNFSICLIQKKLKKFGFELKKSN